MVLVFWGCSSINTLESKQRKSSKKASSLSQKTQSVNLRKSSVKRRDKREVVKSNNQDLELRYNKKHFKFWINYFSKREKERFSRFLTNGDQYKKLVKKIFKKHGLPQDLFYVGLIESGYQTRARSSANAVGPWQFVRGTAKSYGLRVDSYIDERLHVVKSTEAAAQYFKDLYNIFGSWELALCAYNKGEYGIIRAIRKGNSRDYNVLISKNLIPKETIYYIPKIVAARTLDKNRKKFNIRTKSKVVFKDDLEKILLTKSFKVSKVAKDFGISQQFLKRLNPDLKKGWISNKKSVYELHLPRKYTSSKYSSSSSEIFSDQKYRVKKGDNLYRLAKKHKTTISKIKSINHLSSNSLRIGQILKLPFSKVDGFVHRVKRGESLYSIARKFGVSIRKIKSLNSIKSNKLLVNQKILIPQFKEI